jgi:hypothetical protein
VRGAIGFRQALAFVSCAGEQTFDQTLVLPRETAEEDRYGIAFFRSKRKFLGPQGRRCMTLKNLSGIQ